MCVRLIFFKSLKLIMSNLELYKRVEALAATHHCRGGLFHIACFKQAILFEILDSSGQLELPSG